MTDAARFGAELRRQSRRQADVIRSYSGRGIDFNQGGKPKWKQENNRKRCAASGAAGALKASENRKMLLHWCKKRWEKAQGGGDE